MRRDTRLLALVAVLRSLDIASTLVMLGWGYTEANPFQRALLEAGLHAFLPVQAAGALLLYAIGTVIKEHGARLLGERGAALLAYTLLASLLAIPLVNNLAQALGARVCLGELLYGWLSR